jgi:hypothetical protein
MRRVLQTSSTPRLGLCFFYVWLLLLAAATGSHAAETTWGGWVSFRDHDGVDMRVRCEDLSGNPGVSRWFIEFRNRYAQEASFDFRITRQNESPAAYRDRARIAPQGIQAGWNDVGLPCGPADRISVWTNNWQFAQGEQGRTQESVAQECFQRFDPNDRNRPENTCLYVRCRCASGLFGEQGECMVKGGYRRDAQCR